MDYILMHVFAKYSKNNSYAFDKLMTSKYTTGNMFSVTLKKIVHASADISLIFRSVKGIENVFVEDLSDKPHQVGETVL